MAQRHGFSPVTDADRLTRVDLLLDELTRERDWQAFHDPKNLSMLIASEAGELLAEYRWIANVESDSYTLDADARERVESEIADVAIGLPNLCRRIDVDLLSAVERKIAIIRQRYPAVNDV